METINCKCGGSYTAKSRARHDKTNRHTLYVAKSAQTKNANMDEIEFLQVQIDAYEQNIELNQMRILKLREYLNCFETQPDYKCPELFTKDSIQLNINSLQHYIDNTEHIVNTLENKQKQYAAKLNLAAMIENRNKLNQEIATLETTTN